MVNNYKTLDEEIAILHSLKREGEFWDFKREWHKNKGDLLHDIICMANNLSGHNGYIIIGIDEKNNYKAIDVSNDANRKNTQKIVDFLSTKEFAGDIRPFAFVETVILDGKSVDVIVVRADNNVPYYLQTRYNNVCSNNIYIRVGDTNTPIDKSADLNNIEKLWRRRFGMDLSPIDRFKVFLKDLDNWICLTDGNGYYYKYSPEYRIIYEFEPTETAKKYYMYSQIDSNPCWLTAHFFYHQTNLSDFSCNLLDGANLFVVSPDFGLIKSINSGTINYRYYVKDSMQWLLSFLLMGNGLEAKYDMERLMSCVLIFETEEERKSFEKYASVKYVESKISDYAKTITTTEGYLSNEDKEIYEMDYKRALYLINMLDEYRKFKSGI